jgi:hypothetical protein
MQTGTAPPQGRSVVLVVLDVVGVLVDVVVVGAWLVELDELVDEEVLELLELVLVDDVLLDVDVELDVDAAVVLVGAPVVEVDEVVEDEVDELVDDDVDELVLVEVDVELDVDELDVEEPVVLVGAPSSRSMKS